MNAEEFPKSGRLMGIDFGTKRVGLAVSDAGQSIASPLELIQRQPNFQELRRIQRVCTDYDIRGLVVGLPVHMSGDEGEKAKQASHYGGQLSSTLALPVTYWDERFSSVIAETALMQAELSPKKRQKHIDKVAATVLLQSFLDASDRNAAPAPIRN